MRPLAFSILDAQRGSLNLTTSHVGVHHGFSYLGSSSTVPWMFSSLHTRVHPRVQSIGCKKPGTARNGLHSRDHHHHHHHPCGLDLYNHSIIRVLSGARFNPDAVNPSFVSWSCPKSQASGGYACSANGVLETTGGDCCQQKLLRKLMDDSRTIDAGEERLLADSTYKQNGSLWAA